MSASVALVTGGQGGIGKAINRRARCRLHRPLRIRSNALLRGPTLTPMQQRWDGDEETQKTIVDTVPLKRIGTPQDMANACAFLLSDDASLITGTELIVDGGLMARP